MNKAIKNDLTQGNIFLQLLSFFGPLFFANFLQMVYNLVDMAIVGQFVGSNGLAAVSVSTSAITVVTFMAFGVANGGAIVVSQYTGAGRHDRTQKLVCSFFGFTLLLALVLTALSLIFRTQILHFANVPESAWDDGVAYFTTCMSGALFTCEYNAIAAVFRGLGDSRRPLFFVIIATVMNITLDLVFVAVLKMGTFGAALATVIAQAACCSAAVIYLFRRRTAYGFDFHLKNFVIDWNALLPALKLGLPLAVQGGVIMTVILIINRWINNYGVAVAAITGIGNRLTSISQTFSGAVTTSASAVIGQSVGAKKYDRVMKTVGASAVLSVGIVSCIVLLMVLFPNAIYSVFTSDPEVLALVPVFNPVAILLVYGSAFRAPANGLISGTGNAFMNLVLALVDGVLGHVLIPVIMGFAMNLGLMGFWYGYAIAGFTACFVGIVYILSGKWKRGKNLAES